MNKSGSTTLSDFLNMIFIIRHGKTDLNQANVLQGRSDHPLNEEGIIEARQAAEKFKGISFSYVFSSPLQRALQTAKIIVPDLEPIKDDRLIEMDYGPYEGSNLRKPDPELLRFFSDFVNEKAPEGMEELSHIVERTGEFLKEIQNLNGNILVSTHAIAMKGLLENLTPDSKGSYWAKH
ncbi:MAG: histidine phosphatase family protein, partial [Erysipelotrichaceae bacterium]|nr:histidine phosphatase family protein [Erysipelotrichaceae bacterium]